ncbi:MAG: hypothetical protein WC856_07745 [Methylococcaceae bacterium]|jgi:hypothetical protein
MARPHNPLDTRDHQQGQNQSHDMPSDRPIEHSDFVDQFEIVDTPIPADALAARAFFEEFVEIEIPATGALEEEAVIQLSCNNVNQFILRDVPTMVRRKYVEILARAKTENVTTPEYQDANGNRATRVRKAQGLRYPFRVLRDDNPGGQSWLKNILQQAA